MGGGDKFIDVDRMRFTVPLSSAMISDYAGRPVIVAWKSDRSVVRAASNCVTLPETASI
jgi:hypothetical protein